MSIITRARARSVGLPHKRPNPFDNEAFLGYLLLVPTVLVLSIFLAFPFIYGVVLSTTSTRPHRQLSY